MFSVTASHISETVSSLVNLAAMSDVKAANVPRDGKGEREGGSVEPSADGDGRSSHTASLGARIRAARKDQRLTLEELGQLAGISRSFVSQVENEVAAPSIETLRKIAKALGTQVFALVDSDREDHEVVRKQDRKRIRAPRSPVEYELLSPDLQRNMEVIQMELEPGQASTPEPMSHRGEECATLIYGTVRVQVGDEFFDLEEGDTIYFDCGLPHRVENLGTSTARIISAITPPSF